MENEKTQPANVWEWLETNPPLKELCSRYPQEWELVQKELAEALAGGDKEVLQSFLKRLSHKATLPKGNPNGMRGNSKILESGLTHVIRYRMAHLAVKQHLISVASGVESGKIRFNFLNGFIAQKLLFSEGLVRKPVSLFWFKLFWPLIWQKRLLMPLVQPEGIYCFYSIALISGLADLIGQRKCCEIAAGDGTLSRFLMDKGVNVTATDDYSWEHSVKYPSWVVKRDAKEALSMERPEVVICSWPPANNAFEKQIFKTRSVQMYIVIGSRHQLAAGNWDEYDRQVNFDCQEEKSLSRLVLPPELDSAVYVFRRKL
jgi:hypothetical protein